MKKVFALVLLLILLAACAKEELPPSPPSPGGDSIVGKALAGMAGAMPSWAAASKNVMVTPAQPYYGDGAIITVYDYDYVYSNGYLFNSKSRTWEKFALQGEQVKEWIKGGAIGTVPIDANKFGVGDNYLVIYACTKTGSEWDCNGRKWMLVILKVMGSATGAIPEMADIDEFVLNKEVFPFTVMSTLAEKDNFLDLNVIRYDAKYKEAKGLMVLVHVFEFNDRAEVDKTILNPELFRDIVIQGWQAYKGHNVALYLDQTDHRVCIWTSGKVIVYVETFDNGAANKEIIEAYLEKYPSDMVKPAE